MRIAINAKAICGPYGGVNQFACNLEDYLRKRGHAVFRELKPHLDIILVVSSKTNSTTTSFSPEEIKKYLLLHPDVVIVQRINTCDEQRADDLGINRAVIETNRIAHHTVFVSDFIKNLYFNQGLDDKIPHSVILTGVDENVFHPDGRAEIVIGGKIKVVSHHWSSNFMKGFDIYERFDLMLGETPYRDMFSFRMIGNIPRGLNLVNTEIYGPLSGHELAARIRECHLYLTAARHEPGGNHYIEAMRCGLPVLYLESGSSGEYCSQWGGLGFTPLNFEGKLFDAVSDYEKNRVEVLKCPYSGAWMGQQYESLFRGLCNRAEKTVVRKQPGKYLVLQIRDKILRKVKNKLIGLLR